MTMSDRNRMTNYDDVSTFFLPRFHNNWRFTFYAVSVKQKRPWRVINQPNFAKILTPMSLHTASFPYVMKTAA